jgi:hypothetical protein
MPIVSADTMRESDRKLKGGYPLTVAIIAQAAQDGGFAIGSTYCTPSCVSSGAIPRRRQNSATLSCGTLSWVTAWNGVGVLGLQLLFLLGGNMKLLCQPVVGIDVMAAFRKNPDVAFPAHGEGDQGDQDGETKVFIDLLHGLPNWGWQKKDILRCRQ